MPIAVRPIANIVDKYAARAAVAGGEYTAGVANPRRDQAEAAAAADTTWAAGVSEAISRGAFKKGVTAAGSEKWKRKASTVGASRYGPGVSAGKADYSAGVSPYLSIIAGLTLPPRAPRGDPSNVARVSAVTTALRAAKIAKG
jgi:hypothetical protein